MFYRGRQGIEHDRDFARENVGERESGAAHPLLSDRRNVIVIVDEAHRSHYDDLDGYARHLRDALPHATMIAFTGTPISLADKNTRDVFGEYIDVYDLTRAVRDGATVPVYYESRLIPLDLPAGVDPDVIDERVDEATAGLDDSERERIQQAVVAMNALYGAPDRLEKRTLEPKPEDLLLEHGVLTVQRGSRTRVLSLQDYPQLVPLVESIRATLAGDRAALERYFTVQFSGILADWTLELRPYDAKVAHTLQKIQIHGERDAVRTVEIRQSDGDASLLTIGPEVKP